MGHDRSDSHHDLVSAFIKSMQVLIRMQLCITVRGWWRSARIQIHFATILIFASEDVGNADPRALQIALAASSLRSTWDAGRGLIAWHRRLHIARLPQKQRLLYGLGGRIRCQREGALEIPMKLRMRRPS